MFFGFSDFSIFLAYALSVLSAIVCLVYGFINWNKERPAAMDDNELRRIWLEEEQELENELSGSEL